MAAWQGILSRVSCWEHHSVWLGHQQWIVFRTCQTSSSVSMLFFWNWAIKVPMTQWLSYGTAAVYFVTRWIQPECWNPWGEWSVDNACSPWANWEPTKHWCGKEHGDQPNAESQREEFSKLSNGPKTKLTKIQTPRGICMSNSVCHQWQLGS